MKTPVRKAVNSAFRYPPPKMTKARPRSVITAAAWNRIVANVLAGLEEK